MFFDDLRMLSLGLDEQERKNYSRNKIAYNKQMSRIQAKARQEAKLNYCYYCKREVYSNVRPLIPWSIAFNDTPENHTEANKQILLGLLTKDNAWEYEKEWRILLDAKQLSLCQMPQITCVYLGACISEANREKIIAIAKEKNFSVKQMVVDRGTFALHESVVEIN